MWLLRRACPICLPYLDDPVLAAGGEEVRLERVKVHGRDVSPMALKPRQHVSVPVPVPT